MHPRTAELLDETTRGADRIFTFKHVPIQEAAYQSLLKRTRQQYHQQIAQRFETRFPETVERQPELVAHQTEAGLSKEAIPNWQRAGARALERSAYVEATAHLTKGLDLLRALPDTPTHTQHELSRSRVGSRGSCF
jgi:predicted ATPase